MDLSPDGDLGALMCLVARELANMREQLEQVTSGQASLQAAVGRLHTEFTGTKSKPVDETPPTVSRLAPSPPITSQGTTNDLDFVTQLPPAPRNALRLVTPIRTQTFDQMRRVNSIVSNKPSNVSLHRCFAKEELSRVLQVARQQTELRKEFPAQLGENSGSLMTFVQLGQDGWLESDKRRLIDGIVGAIIVLNIVLVSFSIDSTESNNNMWLALGFAFAVLFWVELLGKVWLFGFHTQFRGPRALFNIFDALLILSNTIELLLVAFHVISSSRIVSVFRIVRLLRLARLCQTFHSPAFRDLLSMVRGMQGGMTTLAWSLVFLVASMYVFSLVFRVGLGPDSDTEAAVTNADMAWYFRSVPRSIYTVFRCSFGDCSTTTGTPLLELVAEEAGPAASLLFCGFFFIMVVGMFNVISAIFVESTLLAAAEASNEKLRSRLNDPQIWTKNVIRILQHLLLRHDEEVHTMMFEDWKNVEFPRTVIDTAVEEDAVVKKALADLDIDPHTFDSLSDILDPDNSGTVGALELVDGLRRLRGDQLRSDVVAVDLMMRSMQAKVDDIWLMVRSANIGACDTQISDCPCAGMSL